MGLSSSTPSSSAWSNYGSSPYSAGGDVIRACRCYSRDSSRCTRHSLTFSQDPLPFCKKPRRAHGFATFKKKLIGKCKNTRGPDHSKLFREYALDAPPEVLRSLLDQYEISNVLKDLSVQADLARPPAQNLRQCLGDLLKHESTSCPDVLLTSFEDRVLAHKSIILARCPSFFHQRILPVQQQENTGVPSSETLGQHNMLLECPLPYSISGLVLTPDTLRKLMEYLYTGELMPSLNADLSSGSALVPNSLESDIAFLYDSMSLSDCVLVFGSDLEGGFSQTLHCHRAILAARSSFFRKLIHRKLLRMAREPQSSASSPQRIKATREPLSLILDENVIPARYGKVLLHAMYLDSLDLSLVSPMPDDHLEILTPADEVDNGASRARLLPEDRRVRYAMDLFEIGRFLEFDLLSQSCEDFLAQNLRPENVIPILDWSLKPHGSAWIRRQAFQYVQEEFTLIANSEYFEKLDINILKDLLESDYTQASELEILQAIIRWGELQILNKSDLKSGGEAVPSCHTLSRRNNQNQHYQGYGGGSSGSSSGTGRRREVCDNELRTLISPLLNCLRIQHILPKDDRHSDVLDNALHRNLIPRPPCFFAQTDDFTKYSAWDPRNLDGLYVKPRLFLPYYEEAKNILKDRFGQDISSSDLAFPGFDIPDTLYMVKNQNDVVDILEQQPNALPDKERIGKMLKRTRKLLQTVAVQRAMASPLVHKWDVVHLVELRVVRECNLPDSYTSVLRSSEIEESNYEEAEMDPSSLNKFDILQSGHIEQSSSGPDIVNLATTTLSSLSLVQQQDSVVVSPDIVDGMMASSDMSSYLKKKQQSLESTSSSQSLRVTRGGDIQLFGSKRGSNLYH